MKRRQFNQSLLCSVLFLPQWAQAQTVPTRFLKTIPSSGERIPAVGMGTWLTFDRNPKQDDLRMQLEVLRAFFAAGGGMIDSSPMYGYAQKVLGLLLPKINDKALFSATKVWVPSQSVGVSQMKESMNLWGLPNMDLMMVHNLVSWREHLETLKVWKSEGKVKYIGVTTSHGRRHGELKKIMQTQQIDFVQLTYNLAERAAEKELLPLAQDNGIAVIINRPFQTGAIFQKVKHQPLPQLAKEMSCDSWAAFFLKFVISHPSVTCAIPATSQASHMKENMAALLGPQPDVQQRLAMVKIFDTLL